MATKKWGKTPPFLKLFCFNLMMDYVDVDLPR